MSNISISLLGKIALAGGFIIAGTGFYLRGLIDQRLKKSPYYEESLKILKSNKGMLNNVVL